MEILNKSIHKKPERKIKIMQFGEGNFLRAFVEWILQDLNDKGAIEASVAVVQPMPFGRVKELADQDGLYRSRRRRGRGLCRRDTGKLRCSRGL